MCSYSEVVMLLDINIIKFCGSSTTKSTTGNTTFNFQLVSFLQTLR